MSKDLTFVRFGDSGRKIHDRIEPMIPIGTLIAKIDGHPNALTRIPPRLEPAIVPIATIVPTIPRALPLSEAGKAPDTMPIDMENMPDVPIA